MGQKIHTIINKTQNRGYYETELELNLEKGIYFICISQGISKLTKKIIVN